MFLGTGHVVKDLDLSTELFSKKLSKDEANWMVREVTNEEVKEVMFSISDNRAPGPDGCTSNIIKKTWQIVGEDVCSAVKEFFSNSKIQGDYSSVINSSLLVISFPTPSNNYLGNKQVSKGGFFFVSVNLLKEKPRLHGQMCVNQKRKAA